MLRPQVRLQLQSKASNETAHLSNSQAAHPSNSQSSESGSSGHCVPCDKLGQELIVQEENAIWETSVFTTQK